MMTQDKVSELKANIRTAQRERNRSLPPGERDRAASRVAAILTGQLAWGNARAVLLYAALPDEIPVEPLMEAAWVAQKTVTLPFYNCESDLYDVRVVKSARDLVLGKFGVREPEPACPAFPANQLDFSLIPGLAFDLRGRRVGRGKGFYDRLLMNVRGTRCGIGFDHQIEAEVPVEPHDILLDCILTPSRWVWVT